MYTGRLRGQKHPPRYWKRAIPPVHNSTRLDSVGRNSSSTKHPRPNRPRDRTYAFTLPVPRFESCEGEIWVERCVTTWRARIGLEKNSTSPADILNLNHFRCELRPDHVGPEPPRKQNVPVSADFSCLIFCVVFQNLPGQRHARVLARISRTSFPVLKYFSCENTTTATRLFCPNTRHP